jgi:hypothetical protein
MMSLKVEHIKQHLDKLCDGAKANSLKVKLTALHAVCEGLVKKKAVLTIANVVSHLASNKIKISARTIYNDRAGGNPYREIFDMWLEYSNANASPVKTRGVFDNADILNSEDVKAINDPVIRYRVNLLYAETVALRNQNKMLREIKELPAIHSVPLLENSNLDQIEKILLDPYEIDLLKSLHEETLDLGFNEDGGLVVKRNLKAGHRVIPNGFKAALEKIIRSYGGKL